MCRAEIAGAVRAPMTWLRLPAMDVSRGTARWPVAAGVLLLLLLAVGSTGGSLLDVHRVTQPGLPDQPGPPPAARPSVRPLPTSTATAVPTSTHTGRLQAVVLSVLLVLLLLAVAALAVVLVRRLLLLRDRPRAAVRPGAATASARTLAVPAPDLDDLVGALSAAEVSVAAPGSPRARVLDSWVGLEAAVAAGGHPRAPGETAAELTRRLLGAHLADPLPLVELQRLYEQARYSAAEVGESVPRRAADLLAEVRTGLGDGPAGG